MALLWRSTALWRGTQTWRGEGISAASGSIEPTVRYSAGITATERAAPTMSGG